MRVILAWFLVAFCVVGAAFGVDLSHLRGQAVAGDFVQVKKIGVAQLRSSGSFELKDGVFLQQTTEPLQMRVKIDEQGIWQELGGAWQRSEAVFDRGLFLAILGVDLAALERDFKVELSGDRAAWVAILEPKGVIKKIFSSIEICGGEFVTELVLTEVGGDFSRYIFSNVRRL